MSEPLSTKQLLAVREKALELYERTGSDWYRHVALDADWADDGCENSMDSVLDAIGRDHALDLAAYGVEPVTTACGASVPPVPRIAA